MNTQEIQEILNHLIIGITALYTVVMVVDFVVGIVHLWQKFTVNIENTTSEKSHLESIDIKKSLKLKNQNQSTNRITSKSVQGLNADINKLAMVKLSIPLAKFRTKLICVRHDEIVLECPETEVDQVSHILHNCMVAAAQKFLSPIPVVIDIKTSNSW
jgi:DNA polymerase I-like protein with 3'-5' exonuclease and polymerase domains